MSNFHVFYLGKLSLNLTSVMRNCLCEILFRLSPVRGTLPCSQRDSYYMLGLSGASLTNPAVQ